MNRENNSLFGIRLQESFDKAPNNEIANKLGVTKSAVSAYMKGRIPPADKLIEISKITGCNLHWLLTGDGDKKINNIVKPKTLIFHGSGGGLGTTTSVVLTSLILSRKGKKILIIENELMACLYYLIPEERELINIIKQRGTSNSSQAGLLASDYENIDVYIPPGVFLSDNYFERLEPFKKKKNEICNLYDFIIVDAVGGFDPFDEIRLSDNFYLIKDFYENAKVIIPCQPYRNDPIQIIQHTINYVENAKQEFPNVELLGVFINDFAGYGRSTKIESNKILKRIFNSLSNRMFHTIINLDNNSLMRLVKGKDNESFFNKKSKLLKDYQKLVDEIEQKLAA